MNTVDVGKDFYPRLANRNSRQGDGKHHAEEFRKKYLFSLDNAEAWNQKGPVIEFDFTNVKKIGPSFANEAFAYFTKHAKPKKVLELISFSNISKVHRMIIVHEIESGYYK